MEVELQARFFCLSCSPLRTLIMDAHRKHTHTFLLFLLYLYRFESLLLPTRLFNGVSSAIYVIFQLRVMMVFL